MRIVGSISCLSTKYSQYATVIDLERMVLAVTSFYIQFPTPSTQLADHLTPEPSHQAYQRSNCHETG